MPRVRRLTACGSTSQGVSFLVLFDDGRTLITSAQILKSQSTFLDIVLGSLRDPLQCDHLSTSWPAFVDELMRDALQRLANKERG